MAMSQVWPQVERRRSWRYPCIGEASIRVLGAQVSLQGQVTDISYGGCYVDMMNPLPSDTDIELNLMVSTRRVITKGRVRASRQGFGMGVAFTEIGLEQTERLKELVNWVGSSFPKECLGSQESLPGSNLTQPKTSDTASDPSLFGPFEALLQLLERKGVINCQERQELTEKTKETHVRRLEHSPENDSRSHA
jgi:hypothetical protein